jgi:CRP-like cAMP-binding protein
MRGFLSIMPTGGRAPVLPEEERGAVDRVMTVRVFADGEALINHEDDDRSVFLLLEGTARVVIYADDGKLIEFHEAGPGEMFGELAAIDGAPRSASVVARGEVRAGIITQRDFEALLRDRPGFAVAMLRHLAGQVRRLLERVTEFSTLLVRQRLIRELLRIAEARGIQEDKALIARPPTHFDLAARISTHREAVSREMSMLAKRGLVVRKERALAIPSVSALMEALDDES